MPKVPILAEPDLSNGRYHYHTKETDTITSSSSKCKTIRNDPEKTPHPMSTK